MKIIFTSFLMVIFYVNIVQAQDDCRKWSFGVDYDLLNPVGELRENGFDNNNGVNFDFFHNGFKRGDFSIHPGIRLRGGTSLVAIGGEFIGQPVNQDGTRTIRNLNFDGKFAGRIVFNKFWFAKPYLEADMGIRFTGASERIQTFGFTEEESLDYTEFINKGVSGTYGFGAGVLIYVTYRIHLNLRVNYDRTESIKHVDLNTVFPFDEERTNNANNLRFAIGLHVPITCEYQEIDRKDKTKTSTKRESSRSQKRPAQKSTNSTEHKLK